MNNLDYCCSVLYCLEFDLLFLFCCYIFSWYLIGEHNNLFFFFANFKCFPNCLYIFLVIVVIIGFLWLILLATLEIITCVVLRLSQLPKIELYLWIYFYFFVHIHTEAYFRLGNSNNFFPKFTSGNVKILFCVNTYDYLLCIYVCIYECNISFLYS